MIGAIKQIDGWQSKTSQEIVDALSELVTTRDTTLYTGKRLVLNLIALLGPEDGTNAYRLVSGTIAQAASLDPLAADAQGWLRGEGLDFSEDVTQSMVAQLAVAGNWPDAVRDAILDLGRPKQTKWVSLGGSGDVPLVEQVQAALDQEAELQRLVSVDAAIATVENEILNPVKYADNRTKESIATALQAAAEALLNG